jgi:hypothetical protein
MAAEDDKPGAVDTSREERNAEREAKLSALAVLPGVAKERYGDAFSQHRLEQYKLYVEMADRVSSRRMTANSFFVTINTALVALLGLAVAKDETERLGWYVAVSFAGVAVSLLWYFLIRSYRDLNTAKFNVVHLVESELPLRLYDAEWEMVGRGKNPKLYRPVTHIETKVPLLFVFIYVGLAAYVFAITYWLS